MTALLILAGGSSVSPGLQAVGFVSGAGEFTIGQAVSLNSPAGFTPAGTTTVYNDPGLNPEFISATFMGPRHFDTQLVGEAGVVYEMLFTMSNVDGLMVQGDSVQVSLEDDQSNTIGIEVLGLTDRAVPKIIEFTFPVTGTVRLLIGSTSEKEYTFYGHEAGQPMHIRKKV